eukprot:scaffold2510_cov169-Amphora_coffeaeformis.AAC.32
MWDTALRIFAGLASIGLAIGLGYYVRRIYPSWSAFGWGALCFVLSQVFHIPFNSLVLNNVFDMPSLVESRGFGLLVVSLALDCRLGSLKKPPDGSFIATNSAG